MNTRERIFMGVYVSKGKRPFFYVVIDERLNLLSKGQGALEEVLAYASSEQMRVVGINGPESLNAGLMKDEQNRKRYSPPPPDGSWENLRVSEYELIRRGIKTYKTPDARGKCPEWMRKCLRFYVKLNELGFEGVSASGYGKHWVEAPAEACFWGLLGKPLLNGKWLEGRIQRQLLLYGAGYNIPDVMVGFEEITRHRLKQGIFPFDDLFFQPDLNALASAYTAWLSVKKPVELRVLGDEEEGLIYLPKL